MDPPPAKGSPAFDKDLAASIALEKKRTPDDCAFAAKHEHFDYKTLWSGALTTKEINDTKVLLDQVVEVSNAVAVGFKLKFHRERPFIVSEEVKPCIPTEELKPKESHPSGHATVGVLTACVLAKILPEQASDIRSHGERLGDARALVQVHFPADVAAGKKLGREICKVLLDDENFKNRIHECKDKGKCPENTTYPLE